MRCSLAVSTLFANSGPHRPPAIFPGQKSKYWPLWIIIPSVTGVLVLCTAT